MLFTEWTIGSVQLEGTGQCLPLGEFMLPFFMSNWIEDMIYMPDEIILTRMMIALDLEF